MLLNVKKMFNSIKLRVLRDDISLHQFQTVLKLQTIYSILNNIKLIMFFSS
jgi:hypothetical protein